MTTKRFIAFVLLVCSVGLVAQVRWSNSGNIYLDSDTYATNIVASRLGLTWTDVTLDGTNATCDLDVGTNFRIHTTGNVYILFSNIWNGASGKVKIYADGTLRNVQGAYTNVADAGALNINGANLIRLGYDFDGTAATNCNVTAVAY